MLQICYKTTDKYLTEVLHDMSQVGGGTMPDVQLPTMVVAVKHHLLTAEQLGKRLRTECKPAIVGRIQKDAFIIDLRTVALDEEEYLLQALIKYIKQYPLFTIEGVLFV